MATEKRRLIDANEIEDLFYKQVELGATDLMDAFDDALQDAQTVDAVEVVHGRWEDEYRDAFANPRFRCSICKEKALYRIERDFLGTWNNVQALTPRCPFCGAKMDGERKVEGV